eukprot:TRINITY_DN58481_c0_g1_i1.p1 TRINITY_DN58481_c0_g1~~TRINITY_DN58481_c0_g1_i1.p1  ORF type:complete len:385 (+),score=53.05 TRINITY_DN58481_c0_g1_i1:105-1157(+)
MDEEALLLSLTDDVSVTTTLALASTTTSPAKGIIPKPVAVSFAKPTEAWCQQPNTAAELNYDLPVVIDKEYYAEQYCYWQYLAKTCTSLQACPRPPFEGGAAGQTIWKRLRKLNQKNLIMARMLYALSFFADKHKLKWAIVDGAALGAVRGEALIPHDYDVDVWIDQNVSGGWKTFYENYHADLPQDMIFHHETNRMYLRDLNSCRFPDGDNNGGNPLYGFAMDMYGKLAPTDPSIPIALFTFSGTTGVGKKFPVWQMTDEQLRKRFGKKYATYIPNAVHAMAADFSTSKGCSLMPKFASACGVKMATPNNYFVREKSWSNTTCWKAVTGEQPWNGSFAAVPESSGQPLP